MWLVVEQFSVKVMMTLDWDSRQFVGQLSVTREQMLKKNGTMTYILHKLEFGKKIIITELQLMIILFFCHWNYFLLIK